jgi:hypothetical protein
MLAAGITLPDFKAQHIPAPNQDPVAYHRLHELLLQRDRTEFSLNNMLDDKAADGTALDPYRDFEDEYEHMSQLYDDSNRDMFRIYLNYLEPADEQPLLVLSATVVDTEPPCPYQHARDVPPPPITKPQFEPVEHEPTARALTAHRRRLHSEPQPHSTVWAIADTGASHVLIRESDS